jgi:hypothetical protein
MLTKCATDRKPSWCKIFRACVCYTSRIWNSVCMCTWASQHCCQNIAFTALFSFCFRSWEGAGPLYRFECFAMWLTLSIFHNCSPATAISETVFEVHVTVFLASKCVRLCDYLTVLQHTTGRSTRQDGYKQVICQVTAVLAGFTGA